MRLQGLLTDRRQLIEALEHETGGQAQYSGAPSFQYQVGDYMVLRDGSIEVEERKADAGILRRLAEQGLVERCFEMPDGIRFDASQFTGRTMTNLVNLLSAKGVLINKAIGIPNAFLMSVRLVRGLKEWGPSSMSEFMDVLSRCGGEKAMRGICLAGGQLFFTGFPDTEECRVLSQFIVKTALTSRWAKSKSLDVTSEKYTFRVWLNAIGMKGREYAKVRAELLKNLDGDSSFRKQEQKDAFSRKRQRAPKPEPEFIPL